MNYNIVVGSAQDKKKQRNNIDVMEVYKYIYIHILICK